MHAKTLGEETTPIPTNHREERLVRLQGIPSKAHFANGREAQAPQTSAGRTLANKPQTGLQHQLLQPRTSWKEKREERPRRGAAKKFQPRE